MQIILVDPASGCYGKPAITISIVPEKFIKISNITMYKCPTGNYNTDVHYQPVGREIDKETACSYKTLMNKSQT